MTNKPTIKDSLLLCASDLQHSAIYDNHIEMQSCIRAVADRITALASVIEGIERAALAAPAQPVSEPSREGQYAELPGHDATTVGLGCVWNRHSMRAFADATHALRASHGQAPAPASSEPVERQPLTDEQIRNLWDGHTVPVFGKTGINPIVFARAIEDAIWKQNS